MLYTEAVMNDRHALYLSSSILLVLIVACGVFLAARHSDKTGAADPVLVPAFSRAEFSSRDFLGRECPSQRRLRGRVRDQSR